MTEIQYVDGNVNSPVIVHGEDPANSDNVLVTRLGTSESVSKESVTDMNDHVIDEEAAAAEKNKDDEIASLKQKLKDAEGNG